MDHWVFRKRRTYLIWWIIPLTSAARMTRYHLSTILTTPRKKSLLCLSNSSMSITLIGSKVRIHLFRPSESSWKSKRNSCLLCKSNMCPSIFLSSSSRIMVAMLCRDSIYRLIEIIPWDKHNSYCQIKWDNFQCLEKMDCKNWILFQCHQITWEILYQRAIWDIIYLNKTRIWDIKLLLKIIFSQSTIHHNYKNLYSTKTKRKIQTGSWIQIKRLFPL